METNFFLRHIKGMKSVNRWWAIFSIPFVLFTLWNKVEQGLYKQGIHVGSRKAAKMIYQDIITKAKNRECKTIFVEQAGDKVDLINIQCLHLLKGGGKTDDVFANLSKKKLDKVN